MLFDGEKKKRKTQKRTKGGKDEILKCDLSNESYLAVLSCGPVSYDVHGCPNF